MITDLKINPEAKQSYYERGYWTNQTLCDVWSQQAQRFAERTYVKDDLGRVFTYGEVDALSDKLAQWFINEAHIQNGDVISFQVPKWSEFCVIYVACLKAGAVMHPIATAFNGEDLKYQFSLVDTKLYIAPTFYHKTDYVSQYRQIEHEVPSDLSVLFIDKDPSTFDESLPMLSTVLNAPAPESLPACPSKSDEVACILSTSGTTGRPKAVLLTHNNILFAERAYSSAMNLTPEDVVWMPSPLNHATGFFHGIITTMLVGASVVLELSFKPKEAIELINREGCTWSHGATPFVHDLIAAIEETGTEIPSMRFYLCGGAPVPASMVERAAEHGFLLCESYGSTESSPHVYVPLEHCLEWDGRYSGIPYEGIEVRVVDNNRQDVPCGEQGEEISKGPHQFVGYLNDKERTDEALDDDGWFYSGDLCTMDEQGRIKITGRKKEIIIRGGENISINEIDQNLDGCPGMGAHATVGMPDDRLGERICTFVVPKEGEEPPTVPSVQQFLTEKGIQKRLWPERIELIDAIPYTKTGKIRRFLLAEEIKRRMGVL